jgi:hypothetical protein
MKEYFIVTMNKTKEYLRTARPHLICRVTSKDGGPVQLEGRLDCLPFVSEVELGWDKVFDEGYDPGGSPLGPVYWRIAERGHENLYLSTYVAQRHEVIEKWGTKGLAYCDPVTGTAVARI